MNKDTKKLIKRLGYYSASEEWSSFKIAWSDLNEHKWKEITCKGDELVKTVLDVLDNKHFSAMTIELIK